MDFIIGWQKYETVFKGAHIAMELRPLKTDAMFAMSPHFQGERRGKDESVSEFIGRLTEDQKNQLRNESKGLQKLSLTIFPDHVRDLSGFTINGEAPTWLQLAEESLFMELCVEICGRLAAISNLGEDEEKNLKKPSDSPPPDKDSSLSFSDRPQGSG